jgi:fermentation-respiration switch protein FrsA (DUF1100 family)
MRRRSFVTGMAAGSLGLLGGCAEGLFFHPDKRVYATPEKLRVTVRDVYFGSPVRLHGWWMPAVGTPRATLVHAHGNAANLSHHAPLVAWLPAFGIDVLCFDYQGYGQSDGHPTLDGVVGDTRMAIAQARRLQENARRPLVVLGQSLGAATAVRAVAEESDIGLLILDSAFSSYRGVARDAVSQGVLSLVAPLAMPSLPGQNRDPLRAITQVRASTLLLHGERDRIISIRHSELLHEAAPQPKQFIRIPNGQHIDALTRPAMRERVLAAIHAAR